VEPQPLPDAGVPVLSAALPASTPERRNRFTAALAGGGASSFQDQAVVQGALAAEWGFLEDWGAGLEVGIETSRTATSGKGRIQASLAWVGVMAQRRLVSHLHLLAGARLWLIRASAQGFTVDGAATFVTFGFVPRPNGGSPFTGPVPSGAARHFGANSARNLEYRGYRPGAEPLALEFLHSWGRRLELRLKRSGA
jgi:hypothetical protein